MKKITLVLALILAVHLNTKAQNNLLAVSGHKNVFTGNTSYPNIVTPATTIYLLSDSTIVVKDHAYYLKKSKNHRTAGLVTLGTGLVLSGIGLLMATSEGASESEIGSGVVIMGAGAVSGIISIPLMIIGHVYRNKANLMLKKQNTGFGVPPNVSRDITGISISFPLGK